MNANRMCTLATALLLCCTPGFAQMGASGQQSPSMQQNPSMQGNSPSTRNGAGMNTQDMNNTQGATNPGGPSAMDKMFVKKALEGSMAEVKMGQLAVQKSSDPQVKQFGQRMVDDHTKLIEQMKPVAEQIGVKVPTECSKKDQATLTKMEALSGSDFDTAYIKDMVKDHKADDKDFKQEIASGQSQVVKDAAKQGDQVIESHLQEIQQIAQSKGLMNGKPNTMAKSM
jgi:putative membrane protein